MQEGKGCGRGLDSLLYCCCSCDWGIILEMCVKGNLLFFNCFSFMTWDLPHVTGSDETT